MSSACPRLPTSDNWRFDDIATQDQCRARRLEQAGSPQELIDALVQALNSALSSSSYRVACESAEGAPCDRRVVLQFQVGVSLFDCFFNARTGYRAHFRADFRCGLAFNYEIIEAFRTCLAELPDAVRGHELDHNFENTGQCLIPKNFILNSLDPSQSKLWFCTQSILSDNGVERILPHLTGEKIIIDRQCRWTAPFHDDDNLSWLDIKGAFVGSGGLYQPKDPIKRAKCLQETGTA